ncbi:carboxylesterase/lipase family protein [Frondihabitans australicus]|uniref:Carboxylic ester hydrolase n=1 Tax=Frondihabitans australicus TaxID=386892 RepID=A0A495IE90_9MICO|nr:carboxylesterase family protein [Frondihabitans australicus]RKR73445.1 carboxylesterase type B [Frondihabitans australicus]
MSTRATTVVETSSGSVKGVARDAGVTAFLGVPYAAPPVGTLRFEPPAPPAPWSDVRDCTEHGATAPQPAGEGEVAELLPNRISPGDDHLLVNVWTPDVDGSAPVMVFVHGGSFVTGSGSVPLYDGGSFARDGVVLVTINYRLGAEGFLWTGTGTPNLGLLDQVAALEWVRDEIAAFGGDPVRVTVFGESAGAMSVGALMAMPRAAGLFSRAILESGAGVSAIAPASAQRVAGRLASILGVDATLEGFRTVPPAALVAASSQLAAEVARRPTRKYGRDVGRNLMIFEPVVDGDVLPGLPEDVIAAGASRDVSLMVGTNADEARLFFVPTGADRRLSGLAGRLFAWTFGARGPGVVRRYARNRPGVAPGLVAAAILTDGYYRVPALRLALAHGLAHVYEFAWQAPAYDGRLGACHALELPFVFDTLAEPGAAELVGDDAPQELATAVHDAWVAFATTGDPGWPRYTASERASRRFAGPGDGAAGADGVTVDDRADERRLWRRPRGLPGESAARRGVRA